MELLIICSNNKFFNSRSALYLTARAALWLIPRKSIAPLIKIRFWLLGLPVFFFARLIKAKIDALFSLEDL
jgi:hypothetical protein